MTGLSMSVEHDALAIARMQANIQNQGYPIGLAAATAAKENGCEISSIRALQKKLVELGSLPESVLTEVDSYPIPKARLEEADEDSARSLQRGHLSYLPSRRTRFRC